VLRDGPAPLRLQAPADPARLSIAFVVPSFRRVSGGHGAIAALVRALEARGHACSVWIVPDDARPSQDLPARFTDWFGPVAGPVRASLESWSGADVVVATAWQTVPETLRLPDAHARAYLVQDHEPDFYPASPERVWAAWTYGQGLRPIATSPWLVSLLSGATLMEYGIDHDTYRPLTENRRDDLVLFYARPGTPRRGTALGLLALSQLSERRPGVEIALFGEASRLDAGFPHTHLGVLPPAELARTYARAAVGMALSFTNPSLVPAEMLACGLPCVDVDVPSTLGAYPDDAPVELAAPDPGALCGALERQLDAGDRSAQASASVAHRTWARAAQAFEAGVRAAL
jgi:glycosyltransferase involved in cell wall biosynthesis